MAKDRELLSEVNVWKCPDCGCPDLVEIAPHKHRCAYCDGVLTLPETEPGLEKIDPAIISMLVTLLGFFCFPVASAYLGFLLGGMALHKARAGGGGSERLAKIAVIVGCAAMLLSASVCMAFAVVGTGYELYELGYELGVWQILF